MSATIIADSWWVRVTCDGQTESRIKKAGDPYHFNLTSSGKAPGGTVNCSVCYTPILDVPSWVAEEMTDMSVYPKCDYASHTLAVECECFIMPTNPGQAQTGNTSSRTEKGAPCEGFSEFFDAGLGLVTLYGPNAGGAYTAEGTAPDPGAYCTGCSGTKSRYDLCGCGNPPIEEEYAGTGGDPSYTDWDPPEDSVCAGTPFEQWRELAKGSCRACGNLELGPNPAVGTMLPDWSGWHPQTDLSQVCSDAPGITQHRYDKNGCIADLEEQTVYGTKNCSCECPPGWSDAMPAFDVVTESPCPEGEVLSTTGGTGDNPCETCYKCRPDVGQQGVFFECALEEGCHDGIGWVQIFDADGAIIYDGCPSESRVELGGEIEGAQISVRYSNGEGPCPGDHCCDAAVFNVYFYRMEDSILNVTFLGSVDLNNGDDCGDRGPVSFTITPQMLG